MVPERDIRTCLRRLNTGELHGGISWASWLEGTAELGGMVVGHFSRAPAVRRQSEGPFGVRNIWRCVPRRCWSGGLRSVRDRRPIAQSILIVNRLRGRSDAIDANSFKRWNELDDRSASG